MKMTQGQLPANRTTTSATSRAVMGLLVLLSSVQAGRAQDIDRDHLLAMMQKAERKSKDFHDGIGARILYNRRFKSNLDASKDRTTKFEFEYLAAAGAYRLKTKDLAATDGPGEWMSIVNRHGCFRLGKTAQPGKYELKVIFGDCQAAIAGILDRARIPRGGYWAMNGSLSGYLSARSWNVAQEPVGRFRATRHMNTTGSHWSTKWCSTRNMRPPC